MYKTSCDLLLNVPATGANLGNLKNSYDLFQDLPAAG